MEKFVVQIYEVQTPAEAETLVELGVDHIGSVILAREAWKLPVIKETISITHKTLSSSSLIPLFSSQDLIFRVLDYYHPDIIHFCEAVTDYRSNFPTPHNLITLQEKVKEKFPEVKIMRSIPIPQPGVNNSGSVLELARMFEPVSDYFLTDTLRIKGSGTFTDQQPVNGFIGITGLTCDWDIAAKLVESAGIPVILAGGISQENVFDGIMQVKPAGVDSCTLTNALDKEGHFIRFKKDIGRVKRLIEEVRRAEEQL